MSRSKAKENVTLEEFKKVMKESGVWSSSVGTSTLDESPQAYKDSDLIEMYLEDSVTVTERMKPVYNFKAGEE